MAQNKKVSFSTKFRGYDPEAVNAHIKGLENDKAALIKKQEALEEELKKIREENKILSHRIQIHEKASEEIARLALKEASELIEKAKRNANLILKESLDYVRTLSGEVEGFKEQAANFRSSVQKMSQDLLDIIDNSEVYYLLNEGKPSLNSTTVENNEESQKN